MSGVILNKFEKQKTSFINNYVVVDDTFTEEELNKMCEYFSSKETHFGMVGKNTVDFQSRVSDVEFYKPNDDTFWIFEKLNKTIEYINNKYFKFDLMGYDIFQYSEYDSAKLGRYEFHMDMEMRSGKPYEDQGVIRKLSLTLSLNDQHKDFMGGYFRIKESSEKKALAIPMKKGRIVLFPSFMVHEVTKVTAGTRKSIVVWVLGPKFK